MIHPQKTKRTETIITAAILSALMWFLLAATSARAQGETAVARAILFYSPSCGHCQYVIEETLPLLREQYGEQLEIIGVDISMPQGQAYFLSALEMFDLESAGVPFLVIGDEYLVGSVDIPQKSPTLIEKNLAQGGVDWPNIPGLRDAIRAAQTPSQPTSPSAASLPTGTPDPGLLEPNVPPGGSLALPDKTELTAWQRVALDPLGNGIAIATLVLMVAVVVGAIPAYRNIPDAPLTGLSQWLIPILSVIGLGVAGYLAYVELTNTDAVCGPVGDCNTVQQSKYARLFGALPIGVLGIFGYLAILISWGIAKTRRGRAADPAKAALLGLTTFGIAFSIYLTFLEPFVIGATCAWCVTSAFLMTALFILALRESKGAILRLTSPHSRRKTSRKRF